MFATGKGEVKPLDGFTYIGVIARESWLKKNPDVTVRFLRAEQRAFDAIHAPATTNKARDLVWKTYHARVDKPLFDQLWLAAEPQFPRTIEVTQPMIDRIVNFVNETAPDPLEKKVTDTAWTNDYAAKALASLKGVR
jgi:ABC-type nitrate/sulfonate/bicarbonate transport system substrate-binding protein